MPKDNRNAMNSVDQLRLIQKEIEMLVKKRQALRIRQSQFSARNVNISKMMLQKYKDFAQISKLIGNKLLNAREDYFEAIAENIKDLIIKLFKKYRDINPQYFSKKKAFYLARVRREMARLLEINKRKYEVGKYKMKVGFAKKREGERIMSMIKDMKYCMKTFDMKRYDRLSKRVVDNLNIFTEEEAREIVEIYERMENEAMYFMEANRRKTVSDEMFQELASAKPVRFKVSKALELLKENLFAEGFDDLTYQIEAKEKSERKTSVNIKQTDGQLLLTDDYGLDIGMLGVKSKREVRAKSRDINCRPVEQKKVDNYFRRLNKTTVQRLNQTMGRRNKSMSLIKTTPKKSVGRKYKNWHIKKGTGVVKYMNHAAEEDSSVMKKKMDEGMQNLHERRGKAKSEMTKTNRQLDTKINKKNTFHNKMDDRLSFGNKLSMNIDFDEHERIIIAEENKQRKMTNDIGIEELKKFADAKDGLYMERDITHHNMREVEKMSVERRQTGQLSTTSKNKNRSVHSKSKHHRKTSKANTADFEQRRSYELRQTIQNKKELNMHGKKKKNNVFKEEFYDDSHDVLQNPSELESRELTEARRETEIQLQEAYDGRKKTQIGHQEPAETMFIDDVFEIHQTDFRKSRKVLKKKKQENKAIEVSMDNKTDTDTSSYFKKINKYLYTLTDEQLIQIYDLIENNKHNTIVNQIFENGELDDRQKFLSILKASYNFQRFPSLASNSNNKLGDVYDGMLSKPDKTTFVTMLNKDHSGCYSFFCKIKGQENICPKGYANSKIIDTNGDIIDTKTKEILFKNEKKERKVSGAGGYGAEIELDRKRNKDSFKKLVGNKIVYDILIADNKIDSQAYQKDVIQSMRNFKRKTPREEPVSVTDRFEEHISDNSYIESLKDGIPKKKTKKTISQRDTLTNDKVKERKSNKTDTYSYVAVPSKKSESKKSIKKTSLIDQNHSANQSKHSKVSQHKESSVINRKRTHTENSLYSEKKESKVTRKKTNTETELYRQEIHKKSGQNFRPKHESAFSKNNKKKSNQVFISKEETEKTITKDSKNVQNSDELVSDINSNYFDILKDDFNKQSFKQQKDQSKPMNTNISNNVGQLRVSDKMLKLYSQKLTESLKTDSKKSDSKPSKVDSKIDQAQRKSNITFTEHNSNDFSRANLAFTAKEQSKKQVISQEGSDTRQNKQNRTTTMPQLQDTDILSAMNTHFRQKGESQNRHSDIQAFKESKQERTITEVSQKLSKEEAYSNYFNLDSEINYNKFSIQGTKNELDKEIMPDFSRTMEGDRGGNVFKEYEERKIKHITTVSAPYSDVLIEEDSRLHDTGELSEKKSYDFNSYINNL